MLSGGTNNLAGPSNAYRTCVEPENPATGTGKINYIATRVDTKWNTVVYFGMFYGSDNNYQCRDFVQVSLPSGVWTEIDGLDVDCETGDIVGLCAYSLNFFRWKIIAGKVALCYFDGDGRSGDNTYTSYYSDRILDLYAEGETVEAGNKAFIHYYKNLMAGGVGKRC